MTIVRVANRFTDPVTGETWDWDINHNDESGAPSKGGSAGLQRNLTVSAPVSGGMHIFQEAAPDPLAFSWKGTALTRAQHQEFLRWYAKCDSHTIYLTDFAGEKYEVMIASYTPTRRAVAQNRHDLDNAPTWVYDFQIDIQVIKILAGDYFNAGIKS